MIRSLYALVLVAMFSTTVQAQPAAVDSVRKVESWLRTGVVSAPAPAFASEDGAAIKIADRFEEVSTAWHRLWPLSGDTMEWADGSRGVWRQQGADGSRLMLGDPGVEVPQMTLAAFYIQLEEFTSMQVVIRTPHLARLYVDGEKSGEKSTADSASDESGEPSAGILESELDLVAGKHLVLVQLMSDAATEAEWFVEAELQLGEGFEDRPVGLSISPTHRLRLGDLLDVDSVAGLSLSGDGSRLAVGMRYPAVPADNSTRWIDVVDAKNGEVQRSFRGIGALTGFEWAPDKDDDRFAFLENQAGKTTIWVGDFEGGPMRPVLEGVEKFGSFVWVPGAESIIYSVSEEPEAKHEGIKRYQGLRDRLAGARNRSHLYQVAVATGVSRRLTAGAHSTAVEDVAADGSRLLLSRTQYHDDRWPFSSTQLYEMDLATLETSELATVPWGVSGKYSPRGDRLFLLAAATAFDGVGNTVPEGTAPNLYDAQAFLFDLESRDVVPLSRDFDPAIAEAAWNEKGNGLIVRATAGSTVGLFYCDVDRAAWTRLDTEIDVVRSMSLSYDGKRVAYYGTGLNTPPRVYTMSARKGQRGKLLAEPQASRFEHMEFGKVDDWNFTADDGTEIIGRVYYPPEFDSNRKYPAIVYYYGGTSPVTRDFGGRYPKELWAAHGYVIYVLQPSGAYGFGQDFSARHVNNWGVTVTGEIVQGTQKFLAAHPFVDPERVGCIGASYGGFMTMLLVSQTDIFDAAISHAGISSLSSYWGEGWWGYSYSAAATSHSYPWSDPEFYTEQSALFRADRVNTPLLLLHGGADPNVPPGESEQMYTALKVLGKEVEYILIDGEAHWIQSYDKRVVWAQSILAWFDRELKDEPAYWDHLFSTDE